MVSGRCGGVFCLLELHDLGVNMEDELETCPETHEAYAYLVSKPGDTIDWMADIEDFISTYAFS